MPPPPSMIGSAQIGSATSNDRPTSRPKNPACATPTISTGCAWSVIVRPTTDAIAAVLALPERIAEDRARRAAAPIVCAGQHAAGRRPHAEHVEELAADPEALRGTRLAAGRRD